MTTSSSSPNGRFSGARRPVPRVAGRPRHSGPRTPGREPREEILDAAARLFVSQGVADTSTREIAEEVQIRQASLYYHFASKDEMVEEILQRSVRPTLDKIEKVELLGTNGSASPEAMLYLLALLDVRTLVAAPRNAGVLSRLPEIQSSAVFDRFREARAELLAAYARLGVAVQDRGQMASSLLSADDISLLLFQLVEVVISMRENGLTVDDETAATIADGCLRVCGASAETVAAAAVEAAGLIGAFDEL